MFRITWRSLLAFKHHDRSASGVIGRRLEKFPLGIFPRDFRSSRRSQCVSCWRVNFTRNLDSVRAPADSVDGERETRFLMRSRISRSLAPDFQGANFGKASIQNGSLGGVHLSLAVHCLVASYQASKHAPFSSQVRSHNVGPQVVANVFRI